jgi:hypothetical protein
LCRGCLHNRILCDRLERLEKLPAPPAPSIASIFSVIFWAIVAGVGLGACISSIDGAAPPALAAAILVFGGVGILVCVGPGVRK